MDAIKAIREARKRGYKEWYWNKGGVYKNETIVEHIVNLLRVYLI